MQRRGRGARMLANLARGPPDRRVTGGPAGIRTHLTTHLTSENSRVVSVMLLWVSDTHTGQ